MSDIPFGQIYRLSLLFLFFALAAVPVLRILYAVIGKKTSQYKPEPPPILQYQPGDRLRITQDCYGHIDDVYYWLEAIKGSTARVITLEAFLDYYNGPQRPEPNSVHNLTAQWIKEGREVPVRFETVSDPEQPVRSDIDIFCKPGYVTTLDGRFIEAIGEE